LTETVVNLAAVGLQYARWVVLKWDGDEVLKEAKSGKEGEGRMREED
jgi:hypothetical protein